MSDVNRDSCSPPELWRLAGVLREQRKRWQGGERIRVEDYLATIPDLSAEELLDLIYNEKLLREEEGTPAELEEYVARFPQLASEVRMQFEVAAAIEGGLEPGPTTEPPREVERYHILAEQGQGDVGVGSKACYTPVKHIVALKMIRDGAHAFSQAWTWARRHRRMAGLLGVLALLVAALLIGGLWLSAR
jgi:hypothetical protein